MDIANHSVASVYLAVDGVALHCDHWCAIGECAIAPFAFVLAFHRSSFAWVSQNSTAWPTRTQKAMGR